MKVAICFSGQPRLIKKTIPFFLNNLIEPNNADIFIHSWFKKDIKQFGIDGRRIFSFDDDTENYLLETLKPKKYIFEEPRFFKNNKIGIPEKFLKNVIEMNPHIPNVKTHAINETYSMFYSIFQSNNLKKLYELENDIQYDIVVRCRFDIYPSSKMKFESILSKTIYHHSEPQPDNIICDWFNFGDSNTMNIYSNVYTLIEFLNILSNIPNRDKNTLYPDFIYTWGNEHLIRDLIKHYNISNKKINLNLKLIRE